MSQKSLNVLMIQRPNAGVGAHGLNTQLYETVTRLADFNVRVTIVADPETDPAAYDLVHLYCLPDSAKALRALLRARAANKPVVVTPIYWNLRRLETEGAALVREWAPELIDMSAEGVPQRALVADIEAATRAVEQLTLELVFHSANIVLPQSGMEAAQIERDFGVPASTQLIVPNGVLPLYAQGAAEEFVKRYGVSDFVLCVGRIDPRKNQYTLLRALEGTGLPIVLIGGSTSPEYVAACRRIAPPNTLFLSHFSPEQIAQAGAAGRVHALLSWGGETVGLAALEAAVGGCNIVMTTESSGREYFGDTAWHVDPGDRSAIREAVLAAYHASRGRARERILTQFTWERAARATNDAYTRALAQAAPTYDFGSILAQLAAQQAKLVTLQAQRIEQLWRAKSASESYARQLANGRLLRALGSLRRMFRF